MLLLARARESEVKPRLLFAGGVYFGFSTWKLWRATFLSRTAFRRKHLPSRQMVTDGPLIAVMV